ncbi:SAM-dependent tRNA/rRNA cytosine-C5 methylase [archaeon CG07_land_8_20_14_0_80_38_8]|nr:MAG: SAM-dependent tRNA/rRNA cytosine-C5 methylase [archaeon CG07_land_8_20_14_0_80_38_8]
MLKREFRKSYTERFGEDFVEKFVSKINEPYPQYLRVNTLKIKVDDLIQGLEKKGFIFKKIEGLNYGFRVVNEPFSISSTEEYLLGYFYLQDKSSMLCVEELNPKSSELVLDCCSAPGGKTSHIAQLMNNEGVIIALDDKSERLKSQLFNLQRLGVKNATTFKINALRVNSLGLLFDKILLDAPCSASGTVWRKKKRLKMVNKHEVLKSAELQKELLRKCSKVLKPDGLMVYSTCSIEKEENEDNVIFAAEELGLKIVKTKYLFPHTDNTIGFFYAVMKK